MSLKTKISQEIIESSNIVPAGSVLAFAGNVIPDGYLLCSGAEVSRVTYSKLFNVVGTVYGEGDGSTTFNLPNLIDRFIQGSDTAGNVKDAGLPNITTTRSVLIGSKNGGSVTDGGCLKSSWAGNVANGGGEGGDGQLKLDFDASLSNPIYGNSETVQPPALTMRYYIKY